jgi:hypothetical protein
VRTGRRSGTPETAKQARSSTPSCFGEEDAGAGGDADDDHGIPVAVQDIYFLALHEPYEAQEHPVPINATIVHA